MINYYRFCCRIRIADEYADEVPGGEFLAVEDGDAEGRRREFAGARINPISDWFEATPDLLAHVRVLQALPDLRGEDPILVDTGAACSYTGRTRDVLYRWAREGRIFRYGRDVQGRTLWNLRELPAYDGAGDLPSPPSVKNFWDGIDGRTIGA